MKFGKLIQQASAAQTSLCVPEDWLNYKRLKQILKQADNERQETRSSHVGNKTALRRRECENEIMSFNEGIQPRENYSSSSMNSFQTARSQPTEIVNSPTTKLFFRTLRDQISHVIRVFKRLFNVQVKKAEMFLRQKRANPTSVNAQLEECIAIHLDLCYLRSYGVLNYCGVRKILKKHDKVSGFQTQNQFMSKIMANSILSVHPRLTLLIHALERLYFELSGAKLPLPGVQDVRPRVTPIVLSPPQNFQQHSSPPMTPSLSPLLSGYPVPHLRAFNLQARYHPWILPTESTYLTATTSRRDLSFGQLSQTCGTSYHSADQVAAVSLANFSELINNRSVKRKMRSSSIEHYPGGKETSSNKRSRPSV